MKIVYVHHAERDHNNKSVPRDEQDITEDGIKEAELLAKKVPLINVTKIYSSEHKRCIHTANILNKNLNVDIKIDSRFNEKTKEESWEEFINRNKEALDDIISSSNSDDCILCITSGVNLSAFVAYFTGNDKVRVQGLTMSPVLFTPDDDVF